jgi:hypothetical protein
LVSARKPIPNGRLRYANAGSDLAGQFTAYVDDSLNSRSVVFGSRSAIGESKKRNSIKDRPSIQGHLDFELLKIVLLGEPSH